MSALKRYQAFAYSKYDYAAGGSNDICAEADTLPELVKAISPAVYASVDEVLDLQERIWLKEPELGWLNGAVLIRYKEANPPVQGPKTKETLDMELSLANMLMFGQGASRASMLFVSEETGLFPPSKQ